jgi:hypothetical protein
MRDISHYLRSIRCIAFADIPRNKKPLDLNPICRRMRLLKTGTGLILDGHFKTANLAHFEMSEARVPTKRCAFSNSLDERTKTLGSRQPTPEHNRPFLVLSDSWKSLATVRLKGSQQSTPIALPGQLKDLSLRVPGHIQDMTQIASTEANCQVVNTCSRLLSALLDDEEVFETKHNLGRLRRDTIATWTTNHDFQSASRTTTIASDDFRLRKPSKFQANALITSRSPRILPYDSVHGEESSRMAIARSFLPSIVWNGLIAFTRKSLTFGHQKLVEQRGLITRWPKRFSKVLTRNFNVLNTGIMNKAQRQSIRVHQIGWATSYYDTIPSHHRRARLKRSVLLQLFPP